MMSSPLRVTLLSNFGLPAQGVSPYADMLSLSLARLKDEVQIASLSYASAYPSAVSPNAQSGNRPGDTNQIVHYANPFSWRRFCLLADDVVHIQYWTQFSAYYLLSICLYLRRLGKRSILTVHNPIPHENIPLFSLFEKKLLSSVDRIIVHTEAGAASLRRRVGVNADRIVVIPHGVRLTEAYVREPVGKYVLMFGNIRKYKGTDVLLDAWENIHGTFPDYRLVIAGRVWGHDTSLIKRFVNKLLGGAQYAKTVIERLDRAGQKNVEAKIGYIEDAELDELIHNASIAVFPYRKFSGQSGAAALAAGAGVPIVTSDIPGISVLTIDSSYVASPLDAKSLGRTLSACLAKVDSAARARQREVVTCYSWEAAARAHAVLYQEVANSQ